ncbi:MerR family transcriptional regulator [Siminovitchia fordii]|uniref:MerR family transcriptional regulator n=1 Tax=Siminovitchia fordii TaxID=254759 RepID=UPI002480BED0|nr:MerR family transcriptional regulator [Siminovitchia fordii]
MGLFAKRSNVSISTLHYYDDIGLLPPSTTTDGGHRLYTEEDLRRLQQITLLKRLNFPLKEIKAIIDCQQDWGESLREQLELIREEKRRLNKIETTLLEYIHSFEIEGKVDWDVLFYLTQLSSRNPLEEEAVINSRLSPEEKEAFDRLPFLSGEDAETKEWIELLKQIKKHCHEGAASEKIQAIVQQIMVKTDQVFQGDEKLVERFWELRKKQDPVFRLYPLDPELLQFIEEAIIIWEQRQQKKIEPLQRNGVQP